MTDAVFETSQISLLGDRRNNQDRGALFTSAGVALLVVADGMGGHPKGEEAAQMVVDCCHEAFMRVKKPVPDPAGLLEYISLQAHERIVDYGEAQDPPIDPRTTLALCLVQEGRAWWGHVGDSRLYHFRRGELLGRTVDHSYVERLRRDGLIEAEEMDQHPFKNFVTRCLGGLGASPEPTLGPEAVVLEPGDVLLLCSDGLWGPMGDERLALAMDAADVPLDSLLHQTANMAQYEASPGSDNVTGVALRWLAPARRPLKDDGDRIDSAVQRLRSALDNFETPT
ncbi:MAG: protein phosphatase 2C domain-containing protein [Gammaproteobacteria bacterium SHHR-1]|uniref:PP2C family protein-serine/threonine phosphatase n=1 Tax=Magnetovirga frankeli TaxID=947516 RepID=UPI0012940CD7|nr:serine/threonine-protein phosphatase [gamma proteobacterium SS-5]